MPCYHPITGYQQHGGGRLSFNKNQKDSNTITIPCGQCVGCRLATSREWATRCMHEAQMHKHNCTITLTYNEEHLPTSSSLEYKDFQRFMKYLRKAAAARPGADPGRLRQNLLIDNEAVIRFYMGGEYGEQYGRPHFHACLFGINFNDKIYNRTTAAGSKIYTSPTLDELWGKGFASIGDLTFESAAYIARYIMKKQTGDKQKHYQITDLETGEIQIRKKEFNQMSRKPGIGKTFYEKYKTDLYPHAQCVVRGHKTNTPRYYDNQYKKTDPNLYDEFKFQRLKKALAQVEHHTEARLQIQEQVAKAKIKSLKRKLT